MAELFPDYSDICQAAELIRKRAGMSPRVGVILGSGLGPIADEIQDPVIIPYSEIPYFPVSGAPGHKGQLCIGKLFDVPVLLMQGRIHLYEGYTPQQVTFPIRVMKELGVETMLVTNAAGGVNQHYQVGDLMIIEDHINLVGMSGLDPMRGPHVPELGSRFTSLNNAYDREYSQLIETLANENNVNIHRGVYAFLAGPCFETPAEIRFLAKMGADAVGMSTIPEVMVARHAGIRVIAVSAITNMAIHETDSIEATTEEEVWENVKSIIPKLTTVIAGFLRVLVKITKRRN